MMSNIKCTSCSGTLSHIYTPIKSKRGVNVYRCDSCRLMQSYGSVYVSRPKGSMSCDADRASIKYTKSLVLKDQLQWLKSKNVKLRTFRRVLDIGSNRGSFMNHFLQNSSSLMDYHAVETEPLFEELYPKHAKIRIDIDRIENVDLAQYDFVYFIHTLEHVADVHMVLRKIHDSIKDDGVIYICVPNIAFCAHDSFSEIFIDPHTVHFERLTLIKALVNAGLEIMEINDTNEAEIKVLVKRFQNTSELTVLKESAFEISKYKQSIVNLRRQLTTSATEINSLSTKRIFWGAGRIFDGLVKIGKVDFRDSDLVIDKSIGDHFPYLFSRKIETSDCLIDINPMDYTVIICSNEYEDEIRLEAEKYGLINFFKL